MSPDFCVSSGGRSRCPGCRRVKARRTRGDPSGVWFGDVTSAICTTHPGRKVQWVDGDEPGEGPNRAWGPEARLRPPGEGVWMEETGAEVWGQRQGCCHGGVKASIRGCGTQDQV